MSLITNLHGYTAQAKHLSEEVKSPFAKDSLTSQINKVTSKSQTELERAQRRLDELTKRTKDRRDDLAKKEAVDNAELKEIQSSIKALQSALNAFGNGHNE